MANARARGHRATSNNGGTKTLGVSPMTLASWSTILDIGESPRSNGIIAGLLRNTHRITGSTPNTHICYKK